MHKNQNVQSRAKPITQRLAEAALIVGIITVLASQELRFEGYEAEKIGLLGILAAVILGANLAGLIQPLQPANLNSHRIVRNPLTLAAGGVLVVAFVSTTFSLSPTRSFWGSPSRSQGLISLVLYVILFWQALRLSESVQSALIPALLLIAVPICLLAIVSKYGLDPLVKASSRPGSTTGNPNFLSSWLAVVLLYGGPQLIWRITRWKRPFAARHTGLLFLFGAVLLLILFTLAVVGSRGALLGLGVGLLWTTVAVAALRRKRSALLGIAALAVICSVGFIVISGSVASSANLQGSARVLEPYDQIRIAVWEGAAELVARQAEPLMADDGSPDSWAFVRPLLGYGLDTTEQTYSRLSEASSIDRILAILTQVDRLHNLAFDTLITLGWLGLIAWLTIYEAAFYIGLRWLGFVLNGEWWRWLSVQIIGASAGLFLAVWAIPRARVSALIPAGAALGAIGGSLFWIGKQGFKATPKESVELDQYSITIIAILSVVSAQWIDNQFGFVQAATQPLWWILLGLLARLTTSKPASEAPTTPSEAEAWYTGAFAVGVFLLHSTGAAIESRFITHHAGSTRLLFSLLLITWLMGTVGATLNQPEKCSERRCGWALRIVPAWLIFFIAKRIVSGYVADKLDAALFTPGALTPSLLQGSFQLLSLSGIGAAVVTIGVFTGLDQLRRLKWPQAVVIGGFLLLGSIGYSRSYTGATLHNVGNVLTSTQQADARAVADLAFQAATSYTPTNSRLRLHWMLMLMVEASTTTDAGCQAETIARIDEQAASILRWEPFFVNTKEWSLFSEDYAAMLSSIKRP